MAREGADEREVRRAMSLPFSMGRTALAEAAARGHRRIAEELLDAGAKRSLKDNMGHTPLHLAVLAGDAEMVRLMAEGRGADAGGQEIDPQTIELAFSTNSDEVVQVLLDGCLGEGTREAALVAAASGCHVGWVKRALSEGADPNGTSSSGSGTALNAASLSGLSAMVVGDPAAMTLKRRREVVQALLDAGADPCRADETGWMPFTAAAASLDVSILKLMVEAGASVDAEDVDGLTALAFAIRSGDPDKVGFLLDSGASLENSIKGMTPVEFARDSDAAAVVALIESRMME
jgi:ankyrin repeat protein